MRPPSYYMLCKRIGIVSDWDSWFGNSLHDSVKKYQMSDYFQNNNFVVEAAKVSSTAMQKKIRRKRRRRRRTKHWRSIHGAGSAARRGFKPARRRRQDHTHTHTHTHIDESGLGLRRCISTQVGLHGEPRLTLPTLPTTNSISTPRSSEPVDDGFVQYWAAPPTRPETLVHSSPPTPSDRGAANWAVGQGPPQLRGLHKNSKRILPKET